MNGRTLTRAGWIVHKKYTEDSERKISNSAEELFFE